MSELLGALSLFVRATLLVLLAVLLQVTVATDLDVLGGRPDLVVIVVVSIALQLGPLAGAVAGFGGGFLVDALGLGVIGATSLTLTSVGYAAGLWGERLREAAAVRPLLAIGAASLAAGIGELGVAVLVGSGPAVSPGLVLAVVPGLDAERAAGDRALPADPPLPAPPPAAHDPGRSRVGHRLMFQDSTRRPPREGRPQSVQLALRVAMLGGIAVLLFAVLFFRLWVLQVLSAESYQTAAAASQARTVRVQAPRGRILDINGHVLVGNRPGDALTFDLTTDEKVTKACAVQPPAQPKPPPEPTTAADEEAAEGSEGQEAGAAARPRS